MRRIIGVSIYSTLSYKKPDIHFEQAMASNKKKANPKSFRDRAAFKVSCQRGQLYRISGRINDAVP